ncbi:MAG: hypothetical protein JWO89_2818 [Verrucomicrobiaceae bacterium]|nr:hypothetical protein [Verrucomicrobiaceae bacterium]MDB6117783.1 hypothetical protein [Verrucomicrobiaceae bacterium]
MTWRTFFYCFLCFVAALMVASASSPGTTASDTQSTLLAVQALPVSATPEPIRLLALVLGLIAVMLTFQKAWENMRQRP